MPTLQVAMLDAYQSYAQYRDDIYKWMGLPYYQASQGMQEAWGSRRWEFQRRPLLLLLAALFGSIQSGWMSAARVDRQLDAFQCIEAIRIYAAAHQRFPTRLEEIAEAPVPIDPMTGRPFEYRLDGETATLSAPYPPGAPAVSQYLVNYELKLAR